RLVALGSFDSERRVAAGAAAAGDMISALHLVRKREEGLRLVFGAPDQRVGNAMVGNDGEAEILEASADPFGKVFRIAIGVAKGNGGDFRSPGGGRVVHRAPLLPRK